MDKSKILKKIEAAEKELIDAKKLLKELEEKEANFIKDLKSGDVFVTTVHEVNCIAARGLLKSKINFFTVIRCAYDKDRWFKGGLDGNPLALYSDGYKTDGYTKAELLAEINRNEKICAGNLKEFIS